MSIEEGIHILGFIRAAQGFRTHAADHGRSKLEKNNDGESWRIDFRNFRTPVHLRAELSPSYMVDGVEHLNLYVVHRLDLHGVGVVMRGEVEEVGHDIAIKDKEGWLVGLSLKRSWHKPKVFDSHEMILSQAWEGYKKLGLVVPDEFNPETFNPTTYILNFLKVKRPVH